MEPAEKRCRQEDVSEDPWDDNDDFLHSNLEDIDQIIASQALEPPTTVVSHQSTTIRPTLERNKFSSIITDQLSSKEVENNLLKTENNKLRQNEQVQKGQIKVLRDRLERIESDNLHQQQQQTQRLDLQIREQSEKEKQLVAEVEKLRTQLKYNEFELRKTVADRDAQIKALTADIGTSPSTPKLTAVSSLRASKATRRSSQVTSTENNGVTFIAADVTSDVRSVSVDQRGGAANTVHAADVTVPASVKNALILSTSGHERSLTSRSKLPSASRSSLLSMIENTLASHVDPLQRSSLAAVPVRTNRGVDIECCACRQRHATTLSKGRCIEPENPWREIADALRALDELISHRRDGVPLRYDRAPVRHATGLSNGVNARDSDAAAGQNGTTARENGAAVRSGGAALCNDGAAACKDRAAVRTGRAAICKGGAAERPGTSGDVMTSRRCSAVGQLLQIARVTSQHCCNAEVLISSLGCLRSLTAILPPGGAEHANILSLFTDAHCLSVTRRMLRHARAKHASSTADVTSRIVACVRLLCALVHASPHLIPRLCSNSDNCCILSLCRLCYDDVTELDSACRIAVRCAVQDCVRAVMCSHRHGANFLFHSDHSDCGCSGEVLRCMVAGARDELLRVGSLRPLPHPQPGLLSFIQQTLLLLSNLKDRTKEPPSRDVLLLTALVERHLPRLSRGSSKSALPEILLKLVGGQTETGSAQTSFSAATG